MARLLGVLAVTAGLVALASAGRGSRWVEVSRSALPRNPRLRDTAFLTATGAVRTLLRPLPAPDLRFSLN